ncbi:MAG TPA: tetratricopeptide repeat protein [Bryobacteraceae bacterium]
MLKRFGLMLACSGFVFAQQNSLTQIQHLLDKGNRARAIVLLDEILKNHPDNVKARVLLGGALADSGKTAEAIPQFKEAVRLNPGDAEAQAGFGTVLLEGGDVPGAAEHLDRALRILGHTPDAAYTLYVRARIYSRQGDVKHAAALLTEAIHLRPDLAPAWSDLGLARKALLDDAGALRAFQHAEELDPQDAVLQYRLGNEYLREHKTDLALKYLEAAYHLNPRDQSTLNSLQLALGRAGKKQEAEEIRQKLAALLAARDLANQKIVGAIQINNEGAKLQKEGDLRGALEKYRKALQLDPQHVGIRVNYAIALLRLGQWTDGLNELHEALRRDPGNAKIKAALKDALAQAPPALIPKWSDGEP